MNCNAIPAKRKLTLEEYKERMAKKPCVLTEKELKAKLKKIKKDIKDRQLIQVLEELIIKKLKKKAGHIKDQLGILQLDKNESLRAMTEYGSDSEEDVEEEEDDKVVAPVSEDDDTPVPGMSKETDEPTDSEVQFTDDDINQFEFELFGDCGEGRNA